MQQDPQHSEFSQNWLRTTILSAVMFLALASSMALPLAYTINGVLFAIIGLFFLGRRIVLKKPLIEKSFIGKLPLFFIFFAVSGVAINAFQGEAQSSHLEYVPFLWAPLIFLAVSDSFIDRRILWSGAAAGAFLAFLLALYQSSQLGVNRPEGFALSPITFGNNALLLGAVGAMGRYDPPRRIATWLWYAICIFGLCSGVGASVITQSKGGWPLMLIVVSWVFYTDFKKSGIKLKVAASLLLLGLTFSLYVYPPKVSLRLVPAYVGLSEWIKNGKPVDGSIGPRLELWRFGLATWSEKPWLGHGEVGLIERKAALIAEGKFDPIIGQLRGLHNEFLQVLMQKGLIGVACWIVMFAASFSAVVRASRHVSDKVTCLGNAGLIVFTGSLIFGLTDMNLMLNANRQIFVFLAMSVVGLLTTELMRFHSMEQQDPAS